MTLLLDSHVALWWQSGDLLSAAARDAIEDPTREVWCSAAAAGALDWSHQDPFDRMIVAQALRRRWIVITRDRAILTFVGDDRSIQA